MASGLFRAAAARLRAGFSLPGASSLFGSAAWVVLRGIYQIFRILLHVSSVSKDLGHPGLETATAIYSSVALLIAFAYNFMWWYATYNFTLLDSKTDPAFVRETNRQYAFGPVLYFLAFVFAFINVTVSLAIYIGLMIFFALPRRIKGNEI